MSYDTADGPSTFAELDGAGPVQVTGYDEFERHLDSGDIARYERGEDDPEWLVIFDVGDDDVETERQRWNWNQIKQVGKDVDAWKIQLFTYPRKGKTIKTRRARSPALSAPPLLPFTERRTAP